MELISIGKFAKKVGVTPTTLRRMHKRGDFIPYHVTNIAVYRQQRKKTTFRHR